MGKVYYRFNMLKMYNGIDLFIDQYISIHEAPQTNFCVNKHDFDWIKQQIGDDVDLKIAKKHGLKIYRINKAFSRFASPTREQAFRAFKARKQKELKILKSRIDLVSDTLDEIKNHLTIDDCDTQKITDDHYRLKGTEAKYALTSAIKFFKIDTAM